MSKSLGNAIMLSDDADTVRQRVMSDVHGPEPAAGDGPRAPWRAIPCSSTTTRSTRTGEVDDLKLRYREGRVGDVEVKKKLFAALEAFLAPIRERRAEFAARPKLVDEILLAGNDVMRGWRGTRWSVCATPWA
jgi:tryptophanyl-tRNA synthetase